MLTTRGRQSVNIWPGFVDALASVLLVFVFVLLIFVVGQFFLTELLGSRFGAIDQLSGSVHALLGELSVERERGAELERRASALDAELSRTREARDALRGELAAAADRAQILESDLDSARERARRAERDATQSGTRLRALVARAVEQDVALDAARRLSRDERAQVESLSRDVSALREQLTVVAAALAESERSSERYRLEVNRLGERLNVALAERVEELGRFRSDFFGRLREVLSDREDIVIKGDRFVLPSEVLFPSGSAELEPAGRARLDRLAATLVEVAKQIPADVDWVLRIDGHTDRRPIATADFPSNWELSAARALSIVRYLIERGIEPKRLVAAGFGEFRPLDPADTPQAYARNRRIEIKITGP